MQSVAVLRPHPLIRRDPPIWPFLWRGLLPLAVLAIVAVFGLGPAASEWIEGSVQRDTRAQLNAAGFSWVGLTVSGQEATLSGEEPAAGAGERALALVESARCRTSLGAYRCVTQVSGRFTAPAPPASGALASPESPVQACNRSLAGALAGQQVEFATGSAAVDPGSAPLLDRLAQEVRRCAGIIRIEGHTDTVGRGAFNRNLSQARAAAVRDALIARGVPAEQLRAQGYAARRPVADNGTDVGRAHNRRIGFHALPAN